MSPEKEMFLPKTGTLASGDRGQTSPLDAQNKSGLTGFFESLSMPDLIDRHRWLWFGSLGFLLIISYNGQWLVGPDSAAYRALGHQLATTGRYYFRDLVPGLDEYHNQQGTRYPGLPLVLAGLEKMFGVGLAAPLILMHLLAALTLIIVYRLMLYRMERWLAVCVVVGVGTNSRFLQYANELLSDLPFLLGIVITLLGCEYLVRADNRRKLAIGSLETFMGLVLAASMRPTFWLLAMAIATSSLWGILRGRIGLISDASSTGTSPDPISRRLNPAVVRRGAVCILAVLLAAILFFSRVLDIRTTHQAGGVSAGGYESRMIDKLGNFRQKMLPRLAENLGELLENAIPISFLGCRSGWGVIPLGTHRAGIGSAFSLIVVTSGLWLMRRQLSWGLLVLITVVSLGLGGPIPRYFLMILPLLLAGWALGVQRCAAHCKSPGGKTIVTCLGLGTVLVLNLAVSGEFLMTQWGVASPMNEHHHWQGFKHVGFLRAYHGGHWAGIYELAARVRETSSPDEKIVGPEATILTYLSGRQVYPPNVLLLPHIDGPKFPRTWFPEGTGRQMFDEYDLPIQNLVRAGKISQGRSVGKVVAGYQLAELIVNRE